MMSGRRCGTSPSNLVAVTTLTTTGPGSPTPDNIAANPVGGNLLQRQTRTTPGRLRLRTFAIVALALATGILAAIIFSQRANTVDVIRDVDEPAILAARQVQASLAEADASAANAFLDGGAENAVQRARYEEAISSAEESLVTLAARIGDDQESTDAVVAIEQAVSNYAGLVEIARVNNRQGFPVGAAYLTTASDLLTNEVYPLTDLVANNSAREYRSNYNSLLGPQIGLALAVVGLAALLTIVLLRTHQVISQKFRRRLNPAIALATLLAAGLTLWLILSLASQASFVVDARDDGYSGVREYVDSRALAFRAKGAESRYLIARGNETTAEFDAAADKLEGVLAQSSQLADGASEQDAASDAQQTWQGYRSVHDEIVLSVEAGSRQEAENLALNQSNVAFDAADEALVRGLALNQDQFDRSMNSAAESTNFLPFGALALAIASALLSLFGIQSRINEYR